MTQRTELVRYDAARKALSEARRVDEVKSVHDKAMAMQLYAKQAKDRELIRHATEIRMRAERRAGELLAELKKNGQRQIRGSNKQNLKRGTESRKSSAETSGTTPTLSDLGVTRQQSSRWQQLAAVTEPEFEKRIELATDKAEAGIDAASKQQRTTRPKPASIFSFAERQIMKANNIIKHLFKGCMASDERQEFIAGLRRIVDELTERVSQ